MIKVETANVGTYASCLRCGAVHYSTGVAADKYLVHTDDCLNNPRAQSKISTKAEEAVYRAWEKNR